MKKMRLINALDLADDKYIEESIPKKKGSIIKKRRTVLLVAGVMMLFMVFALWLFVPYSTIDREALKYKESEYYGVIKAIRKVDTPQQLFKNNYEKYILLKIKGREYFENKLENVLFVNSVDSETDNYVEVTDNQEVGVVEADILKRSEKYAFYWCLDTLHVYSIAGEKSEKIGFFHKDGMDGDGIFLSRDCEQVTVISSSDGFWGIDVSDPKNMKDLGGVTFSGEISSSRMIGDKLLLIVTDTIGEDADYSDVGTYVPYAEINGERVYVEAEKIGISEEVKKRIYTTIWLFDSKNFECKGAQSVLGFSNVVEYISTDNIYLANCSSLKKVSDDRRTMYSTNYTEIKSYCYSGDTLALNGGIKLRGTLGNRYWLDEHEGVLRVVTSWWESQRDRTDDGIFFEYFGEYNSNDFLYCIDIETWKIIDKAEGFVPKNENIESVRFEGNQGFICTAIIKNLSDPVFCFDLTDPHNITYKDTGVIDGYSHSLVQVGDYLLGIGIGEREDIFKLELYKETEDALISVDTYTVEGIYLESSYRGYSEDYKDYYIDKENGLIGFSTVVKGEGNYYTLLQFADGIFVEIQKMELHLYFSPFGQVRSFYSDGWLYVFKLDDKELESFKIEIE